MNALTVKNPYSGQLLAELSFASDVELEKAVQISQEAFKKWRYSKAWERSELLSNAAERLRKEKEDYAKLICEEAGKPIHLARVEVERGVGVLQWAAAEAQRFSGELLRLDASSSGRTGFGIHTRFPRGVVLGITPYNFPLNLALHKVAPAIACGCAILIKPSPFTPLTALKLATLFDSAPAGLVQVVLANDSSTAQLTRHKSVAHISFTGSAAVGWMIRKQAPEKPTTLELGGNAWVIVMEDTSPELFPAIAKRIAGAAYGYAGQSCISVQNSAVASGIWKDFEPHLRKATEASAFGDPSMAGVVSGPLIHSKAAEKVRAQLVQLPAGVECIQSQTHIGQKEHPGSGLIPPSLVVLPSDSSQNSSLSIVQEEIFAPVMTLQKYTDLSSLIQKINSSRYGLQAGVFTQDWSLIDRLYRELEVGGLIVNDVPTTRYDHQPYGGVKDSGQGREGVRYAMEEMTEAKFLALSSEVVR